MSWPGLPSFFQAVEADTQYARPLQVADKETPNFAYHAPCFKLAFDVAFGRFERIGQKCNFEQYACNAEKDKAEECGKKSDGNSLKSSCVFLPVPVSTDIVLRVLSAV